MYLRGSVVSSIADTPHGCAIVFKSCATIGFVCESLRIYRSLLDTRASEVIKMLYLQHYTRLTSLLSLDLLPSAAIGTASC